MVTSVISSVGRVGCLLIVRPKIIDIYPGSQPSVSVYCDGATWRGEPELGFWCYDKPEHPGPTRLGNVDILALLLLLDSWKMWKLIINRLFCS